MNAAAIEAALCAISAEFKIECYRVVIGVDGHTVVWALVDVRDGKGQWVGWNGGDDLIFFTKRPRPVGEILCKGVAKGAVVAQDWRSMAA